MRVSVLVGPGPYDAFLLRALGQRGALHRAIRCWPDFVVEAWDGGGAGPTELVRVRGYRGVQRLVWGAWRRLPWVGRYETPRAPLCALADGLARPWVGGCDLLVGWSQVSLWSLRRAKQKGSVTVLEHPMSHVRAWMSLMDEEYARWGQNGEGYHSLFPCLLARRMEREYETADRISVLSSFAARTFVEAGIPSEKLLRVPLGVDPEAFRPGVSSERPFRALYVGRLELLKGIPYLLQAFAEVRLPDAELWLVGPVLPEIRRVLARFAGPKVRIIGEVPRDRAAEYYRQADVFVFPSVNDAFGLVILEAMACGLPVIATKHSCAPDVVVDGVHGFIVPIRDVGALKERLGHMYLKRSEAREMGCAARQRILDTFTWDHYGERVCGEYSRLVGGRS